MRAHSAEDLFAALTELVEEQRADSGTPGVAYGVVGDGAVLASGSGIIGVEDPREVTADTLFQLCSVTKPMTAAVTLGLVEDGLLGLDEPVATYLPELALTDSGTRDRLTLRHLLSHTSGLAGEWHGDLAEYGAGDDALARLIADYPQLIQYAPLGAYWGYCNPGYWLTGRLIEAVTGASFEAAMRARLLAPLGMNETLFRAEKTAGRDVALPHNPGPDGQSPIPDFSFPRARTASGGVLAGVRDVLRFAAAAMGTPLPGSKSAISENVRAAMLRPEVPAEGAGAQQSLGWQVRLTEAGPLVSHGGSYTGYITNLLLAPTHGFAVAVLTNSNSGYKLCREVGKLFAQRILDWQEPEPTYIVPAPHILDRYVGNYAHPEANNILISRTAEATLRIDVTRRTGETVAGDCKALSDTEFTVAGGPLDGLPVTFLRDPAAASTLTPAAPAPPSAAADETAPTNLIRVALRIGNRRSDA